MKVSKEQLNEIIRQELALMLSEQDNKKPGFLSKLFGRGFKRKPKPGASAGASNPAQRLVGATSDKAALSPPPMPQDDEDVLDVDAAGASIDNNTTTSSTTPPASGAQTATPAPTGDTATSTAAAPTTGTQSSTDSQKEPLNAKKRVVNGISMLPPTESEPDKLKTAQSATASPTTTVQSNTPADTNSPNKNSTTQQKPLAALEQVPDFVRSFVPQLAKLNPDFSNKQQDIQKVLNSLVKNKMLVSEQVLNKKSKLKEQASGELKGEYDAAINRIDAKPNTDTNTSITYQDKLKLASDLNIPQMDAQFTAKVENTIGIKNLVTKIKADTKIEDEKLILDILKIVFRNKKLAFNQNSQFSNTSIQQTPSPKKDASKVRGKAAYDSEAYSNRDVVPSFDDQVYGVASENKKLKLKESKEFERMKKLAGIIKG